ncbi:D-alanyl-D-alanine carboxypeptidase family protein [Sinorhizobium mexicanum]|uniref:D-alanyl-D-alanine carboxypeptidase n=1 Tax=Sinorhizobium mexicanum TaxID=375549 RepID=A0A859QIT1_9HYPH|nr:D-alanyl-D-alanine carboxypeptidase family protein [Sinorhizobium mexicanum]MBP1883041.1 D-alanyl-D-alanine carboxypeptidase (penicillin-binding protein 5/6) [Sinorhizobium mexicanum]QLL60827.1 D-alanyl-D-alanine carboxypeptidase [Sinorhizobium mexicanum]
MKSFRFALVAVAAFVFGAAHAVAGSASLVLDARTGRILAAENADALNHPASLTKMMTLYLTFEALHQGKIGWSTPLVMSPTAARKPPTKLGVRAGDTITVQEAVYGMIVRSANDAAAAVAEALGGSEAAFAQMMTAKARRLGMTRTYFVNASGLPAREQVTTARDMARLAIALMRDFPGEYRMFAAQGFTFRGRTIRGHNNLMYRYAGMDGIKTGYTNASGYNIVSAVRDGNRRVIGVVLGGRSAKGRDDKMASLLDQHLGRAAAPAGGRSVAATSPQGAVEVAGLPGVRLSYTDATRTSESGLAIAAASTAPAMPSDRPTAVDDSAGVAPTANSHWQIQISTAATAEGARKILVEAQSAGGAALLGASPHTEVSGTGSAKQYRARFIGFASREAATSACAILKKRSYECTLLPDRG